MSEGQSHSYQFIKELFDHRLNEVGSDASLTLVSHIFESKNRREAFSSVETIEETLLEMGVKKGVVRRIYSISIEALQNMKKHSAKDENGDIIGGYCLSKSKDTFFIDFINLTNAEQAEAVRQRVDKLNEMDAAEIKQHYLTIMQNGEMSVKGGAGLGLITMVMKSKNPVNLSVQCSEEQVCGLITKVRLDLT